MMFSIGDWFVLYQMNKQMSKRFFSEFLALLSIKVRLISSNKVSQSSSRSIRIPT